MKKCLALLLLLGIVPAWATPNFDGNPFQGEVLESINAGTYTYLRLKTKDGEVWAATMLANFDKGARVQLHDPALMTNFQSKALNRTFDEIVFASAVSIDGSSMTAGQQQAIATAHRHSAKQDANVAVAKSVKAAGSNGRTVAEVYAQRDKLKDKPVAVRGTVVKVSSDIMNKNWVHLRDGSGNAADATNDLLVTTAPSMTAKVGDVVLATGTARTDANFGSGYACPVLIEAQTLTK